MLPESERLPRHPAQCRRLATPDAEIRRQHDLAGSLQPAAVVAEVHVGGRYANDVPAGAHHLDGLDQLT